MCIILIFKEQKLVHKNTSMFSIGDEINCYNERKSKKEAYDCLFNYIFERT
jgi:hypothetical protein